MSSNASGYVVRRPLTEKEREPLMHFSPLVAQLLFHRGFKDTAGADIFMSPDYDRDINDPFLLKDAEKSAERIIKAIKSNTHGEQGEKAEKIAIYADYDADGIPGAAMFHDFFHRIGFKNFKIYIPHRHNEGFGINTEAVEQLASEGVKLIVSLDCGISDFVPVARANELGMEVIITDHHEAPEKMPVAFAIIDHKQEGCEYPDKNICGTGVAYKLIQAILKKDRLGLPEGHEKWLLDLVGIATLSDMVPLVGENRVFAKYGMSVLRKSQRKGLKQLLGHLRISQPDLTEDDVAFMITPRINAASRMGVPMDAFDLLAAENDADALKATLHLDHINNERKGIVASLVKEIKKILNERHNADPAGKPYAIVLGNPDWKPSLLGLAANSCAEEFDRPVFLWGRDGDNIIKGSCRSEGKSNVVEIMRAAREGTFTQFGGHKYSGGFAVSDENIHFLEMRINEAAKTIATDNAVIAQDEDNFVDAEISIDEVSWDIYNDIAKLAPFGVGNRKPLFILKNVTPSNIRIFGKGNEHIELGLMKKNGSRIPAISFFGATTEWAKKLLSDNDNATAVKRKCHIVASLERSTFRGRPELRLRIEDVVIV